MVVEKIVDIGLQDSPTGAAEFEGGEIAAFDVFEKRLAAFDTEIGLDLGESQKQFVIFF